jgi:hypothetical protein
VDDEVAGVELVHVHVRQRDLDARQMGVIADHIAGRHLKIRQEVLEGRIGVAGEETAQLDVVLADLEIRDGVAAVIGSEHEGVVAGAASQIVNTIAGDKNVVAAGADEVTAAV